MNFTHFKHDLVHEFGLSSEISAKIVSYILKKIRKKLLFGEEISFWKVGTLKLIIRKPRAYKHLKTGKMAINKKSYYLKFETTPSMKVDLKNKKVY